MTMVHYKGEYNSRTACGRTRNQRSETTTHPMKVTCPRCKERLDRAAERSASTPVWHPDDDRVAGPHGAFKIHRNTEGMMKTTIRELKQVIQEALEGDFKPGTWYTWHDARGKHTGKLVKVYQMQHAPAPVNVVKLSFGGHSTEMRFDLWAAMNPTEATPEEVSGQADSADADRKLANRGVDTSKEGT
jgi:hypothetical protein